MVCPYCSQSTPVINSRPQKRLRTTWRRRKCATCRAVFTTTETIQWETSLVVQYNKSDVRPFDRDLLFVSIYESCKHRPKAISDAKALTQTIMSAIMSQMTNGAITRQALCDTVAATLGRFDTSAATIYTAYHPST